MSSTLTTLLVVLAVLALYFGSILIGSSDWVRRFLDKHR